MNKWEKGKKARSKMRMKWVHWFKTVKTVDAAWCLGQKCHGM